MRTRTARVALVGCARVSTAEQNLDLQRRALAKAGREEVYEDHASGSRAERPGLAEALRHVRRGDTLVVWKLDRLGRSMPHLIEMVRKLDAKGVDFCSLTEGVDTQHQAARSCSTSSGRWRSASATSSANAPARG